MDELLVDELCDAGRTELAPHAGALGPTKGELGSSPFGLVDLHHARIELVGHLQGQRLVLGENGPAETVR